MNAIRKIKSESLQIKRELVMLVQSQSLRTRKSKLVSCIAVCNGEGLKLSSAYGEALVDLVAAGKRSYQLDLWRRMFCMKNLSNRAKYHRIISLLVI